MKKDRQSDDSLAAWADQVLKQLPPRPAPASLAPRVLAALARQQVLPWYRQPWFVWPRHIQILAALASAVIIGLGVWFILPQADSVNLVSAKQAVSQFETVREAHATAEILKSLGSAIVLVVKSLDGWLLAGVLAAFALVWSTTIGLGTACWRLASGSR